MGGIPTWNEIAAALRADPDPRGLRGELTMYAEWLPPGTDPDRFDPAEVNAELARRAGVLSLPTPHPVIEELLARTGPETRTELLDLLLAAHRASGQPASDEQWSALLRRWQSIVEVADPDGIPLTAAGWIAPAYCERLAPSAMGAHRTSAAYADPAALALARRAIWPDSL